MSRPIEIVRKVCPKARESYLAAFEHGDGLFARHDVTTPIRLAHFLAQCLHETGGLRIEWESGAYSAERLVQVFGVGKHSAGITAAEAAVLAHKPALIFERVYGLGNPKKAKELGNTKPGDGYRYRGGGIMQTTGRYNYRTIGEKCGVDFENHPEWVVSAEHALKPALAEWTKGRCNDHADRDDILAISRVINLGNAKSTRTPNGLADRKHWYSKVRPIIKTVDLINVTVPAPTPLPPKPASNVVRNTTAVIVVAGGGVAAERAHNANAPTSVVVAIVGVAIIAAVIAIVLWRKRKTT